MTFFPKAMLFSEPTEMSCPQHGTSAWLCISARRRLSTRDLEPTLGPKPGDHLLSQQKGSLHHLPLQTPPSLVDPALGSMLTPHPALRQPQVQLARMLSSQQCQALLLWSPWPGGFSPNTLLGLAPAHVPHHPSSFLPLHRYVQLQSWTLTGVTGENWLEHFCQEAYVRFVVRNPQLSDETSHFLSALSLCSTVCARGAGLSRPTHQR